MKKDSKLKAMDIYEHIAVEDIQSAADILKPVYEKTQKRDGYVSMEVSPFLANDTEKTIEEAKRSVEVGQSPQRDDKSAGD